MRARGVASKNLYANKRLAVGRVWDFPIFAASGILDAEIFISGQLLLTNRAGYCGHVLLEDFAR